MPPPDLSDLDRLTPRRERKLRDMRPMEIALAAENAFLQRRMALDGWLETISVADSGAPPPASRPRSDAQFTPILPAEHTSPTTPLRIFRLCGTLGV